MKATLKEKSKLSHLMDNIDKKCELQSYFKCENELLFAAIVMETRFHVFIPFRMIFNARNLSGTLIQPRSQNIPTRIKLQKYVHDFTLRLKDLSQNSLS